VSDDQYCCFVLTCPHRCQRDARGCAAACTARLRRGSAAAPPMSMPSPFVVLAVSWSRHGLAPNRRAPSRTVGSSVSEQTSSWPRRHRTRNRSGSRRQAVWHQRTRRRPLRGRRRTVTGSARIDAEACQIHALIVRATLLLALELATGAPARSRAPVRCSLRG
jgi:hypothetical protein